MNLLLCYDNEGVYVNTMGRVSKNFVLQWGEMPTSVAYIGTGQIMGWGNKAIEVSFYTSNLGFCISGNFLKTDKWKKEFFFSIFRNFGKNEEKKCIGKSNITKFQKKYLFYKEIAF